MLTWLANHAVPIGVALAIGAVLAVVGLSRQPPLPIEVRSRDPQPTSVVLVYVHVDGAVLAPGVYALPAGARIFEAIAAAGGPTEDADPREMNLAARVADGQKLVMPAVAPPAVVGEDTSPAVPATPAPIAPPVLGSPRININTATQRILETLPGIGPVTAGRIIEYRQANGPFTRIEQLRDIRLVNAPVFERIRNLISVD